MIFLESEHQLKEIQRFSMVGKTPHVCFAKNQLVETSQTLHTLKTRVNQVGEVGFFLGGIATKL